MDFDEELPAFSIRKTNLNIKSHGDNIKQKGNCTKNRTRKFYDYIPLTLRDLSNLNQDSWKKGKNITIFNEKFEFKKCLIYCTVLTKTEKTNRYSYTVDDSTAKMEMSIHRKLRDQDVMLRIQNELYAMKEQFKARHRSDILSILLKLLQESNQRLVRNIDVNVGSKVLVIGKPSYFRETVSIDAFHILPDDSNDRMYELAFKKELIDWYTTNLIEKFTQ